GGRGALLHALHRRDRVLAGIDDVGLHHLGRGAFVGDLDVDDREVHVGVLRDAQPLDHAAKAGEADEAEEDESGHEHPGQHVVADGDIGQRRTGRDLLGIFLFVVHFGSPAARPPGAGAPLGSAAREEGVAAGWTGKPSASRSEPSTTTTSPAFTPETTSTRPVPVRNPIWIGRSRAFPPSTTYVTNPFSLAWTAPSGTTRAPRRVSEASVTSAKKPGFSSPGFFTQAITSTWRVAGSATSPT